MKQQHIAEAIRVFEESSELGVLRCHLGHTGDAIDIIQTAKQCVLLRESDRRQHQQTGDPTFIKAIINGRDLRELGGTESVCGWVIGARTHTPSCPSQLGV